ncbi:2-phosphosulfolactate phosphatase [Cytophagaceae bacterium ABcell3]|nr:2-phosphosulfolactate phosphatase [Cytophagaceae bacterium ABcell3]
MRNIDVCLTPELLHLYDVKGKVVVVVDVLRATSCMVSGIAHGVEKIIPVATLEECLAWKSKNFITAAERDGKKAEGFDIGNSPFSYMDPSLSGKTVVVTTTNGTLAITKSAGASEIIAGAFLNKSAVVQYLENQPNDVLVLCAGWKGKVNLEDTLFAGAVVEGLQDSFFADNDAAMAALSLYKLAKQNLNGFLANSSHARRLKKLNIKKDIEFCLTEDLYSVVPVMDNGCLVCSPLTEVKETAE